MLNEVETFSLEAPKVRRDKNCFMYLQPTAISDERG
jgi:hypothetical protein